MGLTNTQHIFTAIGTDVESAWKQVHSQIEQTSVTLRIVSSSGTIYENTAIQRLPLYMLFVVTEESLPDFRGSAASALPDLDYTKLKVADLESVALKRFPVLQIKSIRPGPIGKQFLLKRVADSPLDGSAVAVYLKQQHIGYVDPLIAQSLTKSMRRNDVDGYIAQGACYPKEGGIEYFLDLPS